MQIQLQGKKFAPSRTTQCWKRMVMPLTLRTWAPAAGGAWPASLAGVAGEPLGVATVVDLAAVCSWPVLSAHAVCFDLTGGSLPFTLPEPVPVRRILPRSLPLVPALLLLMA